MQTQHQLALRNSQSASVPSLSHTVLHTWSHTCTHTQCLTHGLTHEYSQPVPVPLPGSRMVCPWVLYRLKANKAVRLPPETDTQASSSGPQPHLLGNTASSLLQGFQRLLRCLSPRGSPRSLSPATEVLSSLTKCWSTTGTCMTPAPVSLWSPGVGEPHWRTCPAAAGPGGVAGSAAAPHCGL